MTVALADNVDQRFAASLANLESGEPPRRRQAIAFLEKLGGLRAFQVASALVGDSDPIVAAAARRICAESSKKGLILRNNLQAQPLAQKILIKDFYQLLDEVVFVIRRNLNRVVMDSFLFSIPKFALVTLIFLCPYFEVLKEVFAQGWIIFPAIFVYEAFWRPLIWSSTGAAVLEGFPENVLRRQSMKMSGVRFYRKILFLDLVESLLYAVVLTCVYAWYLNYFSSLWPAAIFFLFWAMIWVDSSCSTVARILISDSEARILWRSGYIGNFTLAIKLGMVLALLYLMIVGSSVSLLWIFGFDALLNGPILFLFGFVIAADALLDPFVMGYRILLTRLSLDPGCL
ncbi:MAG: hypothetical protein GX569_15245 [Candidatus Riflebacteria bacterium]|nr:hypothetical protein [Candidatus Riflebacteria bacterium]